MKKYTVLEFRLHVYCYLFISLLSVDNLYIFKVDVTSHAYRDIK